MACGLLSVIINPWNSASTDPGIIRTTNAPTYATTKTLNQYKVAPILGSDVSVFLAKYGEPDVKASDIDYLYISQGLVVLIDAGATRHVNAIQRTPINGSTWDRDQAKATCLPYMPSDAKFKRTFTIYEKNKKIAIDYVFVYFSSSLAKRLPASDFMDQNFKHDKPGTFVLGLSYKLGSTKAFNYCFVAASMQKEIRK